jgi:hypothetical protein
MNVWGHKYVYSDVNIAHEYQNILWYPIHWYQLKTKMKNWKVEISMVIQKDNQ